MRGEQEENYKFGEIREETFTNRDRHTIKALKKKKTTLTMMATRGYSQVPFSCILQDTLTNGSHVDPYKVADGVFSGMNYFSIHSVTKDEDL